jgi:hypothetical protein
MVAAIGTQPVGLKKISVAQILNELATLHVIKAQRNLLN